MTPSRRSGVVLAAALAYAVALSTLSLLGHHGLRTQMNDLGNADQAIWAASHGDWRMMQSNDLDGHLRSRIAVHANFVFWPLSVLYRLAPFPDFLLILTTLACTAAGLGLYAHARHRLGDSWWSVIPPLAFWASPLVHDANLYDFHVVTLVSAFLVWALWAFEVGRKRLGWSMLVLAILCKEDVALMTAMVGVGWMLDADTRRRGITLLAISLVYFVAINGIVVPLINGGHGPDKLVGVGSRYRWLGATPRAMIRTVIAHPLTVTRHVLQADKLRLPLYLLVCGGLAGLRSWRLLLILLPQLAMAMMADAWMTRVTGTYYWITSEALIILACLVAATARRVSGRQRAAWPLAYLAGATAVSSLLLTPLPYGLHASMSTFSLPEERATLETVKRLIPAEASLCVQNNLGSHFSQREDVSSLRLLADGSIGRCQHQQYALFWLRHRAGPNWGLYVRTDPRVMSGLMPERLVDVVRELAISREWRLLFHADGFYLFTRAGGEPAIGRPGVGAALEGDIVLFLRQVGAARTPDRWAAVLNGNLSWSQAAALLRWSNGQPTTASCSM